MIESELSCRTLSRRRFISLSFGALACGGVLDTRSAPAAIHTFRRTGKAFGATVSLTVLHADSSIAEPALAASFAELDLIERIMSLYLPDSQITVLNRAGELKQPHPYLTEVLRHAASVSERSDGAFDVTVQPLWNLFSQAKTDGKLPAAGEIERAQLKVNWRHVELAPSLVRFRQPGTAITLNGIAQGFAVDQVRRVLRSHDIEHALIDCGELGALGKKPDQLPWKIGIQHPRRPEAYIATAQVADRCLATSGDYATFFTDDFRAHHIFDPRTGRSPAELASVTVAAPSGVQADALSTALFVLGPDRGQKLLESGRTDALFVLKDGHTFATPGFPWTL